MTTIPTRETPTLATRTDHANPNHHLWNNNGTWWCHFTVHLPNYTKQRIRCSLHTGDLRIARILRDSLLHETAQKGSRAFAAL